MPYVKFTGGYEAFVAGRDVDSALHYEDASNAACVGIVPAVREGDIEISEAEYTTLATEIDAYNAALPEPEPVPVPDPNGFLAAGRDEYGAAFWLTIPFPGVAFILEALNKGDWPSVRLGMDAMLQAEVITSEQHERLHELLDEYHIPPLVAEG